MMVMALHKQRGSGGEIIKFNSDNKIFYIIWLACHESTHEANVSGVAVMVVTHCINTETKTK